MWDFALDHYHQKKQIRENIFFYSKYGLAQIRDLESRCQTALMVFVEAQRFISNTSFWFFHSFATG